MLRIIKSFGRHQEDSHEGVLVPLEQVQRYASVPGDDENDIADPRHTGAGQLKVAGDDDNDNDNAPLLVTDGGESLARLRAEIEADMTTSDSQTTYDLKSKVFNKAIQDIGMGRYQWELFALCGMGWFADNLWMGGLSLVLPRMSIEFGIDENKVRYTTMFTFIGLSIGSSFWGIASDIIGRRPAFNATLLLCGAFGFATGFGPSWIATSMLFLCMGLGVGGNLPVDGALFLEFLPFDSGHLLTLLSVWWPVGQLAASLLAWAIIPTRSCDLQLQACFLVNGIQPCCSTSDNMGWRYFIFSLGILTLFMFVCRYFLFTLYESPKFLLSHNRQAEAVSVIHAIAYHNKSQTWLTEDILNAIGGHPESASNSGPSAKEIGMRKMQAFSLRLVRPLFKDSKLALSTSLIWFIWAAIGMGYPLFNAFLPQYLQHIGDTDPDDAPVSTNTVYADFAITSIVGLPGALLAGYAVDLRYLGRRGTLAISTLISGLTMFLFTYSTNPGYQTFCSSLAAFFQNIMYGVLYAYTPEVFPSPNRGTGTGIASLLNRIAGMCAPVVAATVGAIHPAAPIIGAGVVYVAAFAAMCILPIETRGKQSL